jgi:hypothetical protein
MEDTSNQPEGQVPPSPVASPMRLWQLKQAAPICPTCQTYCRCLRTLLKENTRVQYRYCDCGYKMKTIVPLK